MIHVRRGAVQIYDTDASGLIFFAAPLRWFAEGEEEYMDRFGLLDLLGHLRNFDEAGPMAPTRAYEVALDRPLRFRDRYEQRTWIGRVGATSYSVEHLISVDGQARARGTVHRVTVTPGPDGTLVPMAVPEALRDYVVDGSVLDRSVLDGSVPDDPVAGEPVTGSSDQKA
ncbi:MAG TPA: acyl-CoA thioesterase [Acidimicrobiales bacterium]|jgi:acyl-CoA thioesterase FadM|nr:acyl-CoA thioesterase [Acidimicrobiales bacterium]